METRDTIAVRRPSRAAFIACMILLLAAGSASGQQTTGTVSGLVSDPSGAPVAAAAITLTNSSTGVEYRQTSAVDGSYVFNFVPPGPYEIEVSKEGFQTKTITGIAVQVYRTAQFDVALELAAVSESVVVTAPVATIDTASASMGTNVETRWIPDLPNSSRNVLKLLELAPGVQVTRDTPQMLNIEGTYTRVNGLRSGSNVFSLDGSDNSGSFRNGSLQFPNPEAVQEVQVSTASTSAELGRQPGGIFNVITKSGTNEFHGSGFWFFRSKSLNANQWSRNRSGAERPEDNENRAGATFGGPIVKNKTFFFGSFMAYRNTVPGFRDTVKYPTQAMVGGDFSQFDRPLYDPDSGAPLPGNRIPERLLDPVARNLSELFPKVPNFGDRYVWSFENTSNNNEALAKIDHTFSDKHSIAVSYFSIWGNETLEGATGSPAFGPQLNDATQHTLSGRHTWVVRPTLLIQSRFSMGLHDADRRNAQTGRNLEDFGANWPISSVGAVKHLPNLSVSDGFSGSSGYLSLFTQHNHGFDSTLTWTRGSHNIKAGFDVRRAAVRQLLDQDRASFSFDGRASSKPAGGKPGGIGVFGYASADFFMGRSSSFSASGIRDYDIFNWMQFFFIQDEWRVTRKLTLTPGLRYEIYQPAKEKNNRLSSFAFGHKSNQYPNAPLHMAFAGDEGFPEGGFYREWGNLAPRLGIAYDPMGNGKTAIRVGAGYYYSLIPMQSKMGLVEQTPWSPSASGGETLGLVDPWGTSRTVVYEKPPTPFSLDVSDFNYPPVTGLSGYELDFRTPYTIQWNISVQRAIANGVTLEAAYVANRGYHFIQNHDLNYARWSDNATTGNVNARRPIAGYQRVTLRMPRAKNWYDALQVTANVRFSDSFLSRLVYVYGKSFSVARDDIGFGKDTAQPWGNPENLNGEKMDLFPHHTFRYFWVYEVPFLRNNQELLGRLLGNWQITGSIAATSGSPLDLQLGEDWNLDGISGDRPDQVGPIRYTTGSADERMQGFFDPSAFAKPPVRNVFGTLKRNALFGPGSWNTDLAVLKRFPVTEKSYFEFRGEAYNWMNHPNLANPNTNMKSGDYTRILSKNGNRTMQLGLRFVF